MRTLPFIGTLQRISSVSAVDEYGDQDDTYSTVSEVRYFVQPETNRSNDADAGYEQGIALHFSPAVEVRKGDRLLGQDGNLYEVDEAQEWYGLNGTLHHYRAQATLLLRTING